MSLLVGGRLNRQGRPEQRTVRRVASPTLLKRNFTTRSLVGQGHGRVPLKIQGIWALRLFDIHGQGRIKPGIFELAFQQTQRIAARVAHQAHGVARVA